MSKKTNPGNSREPETMVFIASNGKKIHYVPVSATVMELIEQGVTQEFRERGEPIEIPTYTVEAVGGVKQTFEHDEKTLVTPEHHEAWDKYIDARARLEQQINSRRAEACLLCIQADPEEDKTWRVRQKRLGIRIPENTEENPDAVFLHYVQTVLLSTAQDAIQLVGRIMVAGLQGIISEEQQRAAEATFQDIVENAEREIHTLRQSKVDQGIQA